MEKVIGILPLWYFLCENFHISSACRNISDYKKEKRVIEGIWGG